LVSNFFRSLYCYIIEIFCIFAETASKIFPTLIFFQNIEQGKEYKVIFYVRSTESLNLTISLIGSNGVLASSIITWAPIFCTKRLCATETFTCCSFNFINYHNAPISDIEYWSFSGDGADFSNWTKEETVLVAKATDHNARLQLTTTTKGVIWLDQVSAMPLDTYKVVFHP